MKKKPHWLRLDDFLTLAGPGIGVLGLLVYCVLAGYVPGWPKGAWIGMLAVGLTFIGIWARVVFLRKKALAKYRWYPTYGFMVHDDGGKYHLPGTVLFEAAIWRTIQAWAPYYKSDVLLKGKDVFWVFFKKDLDENTNNLANMKVEGLTIARSHTMQIDYDSADQPLEKTAFEHELGHIIMGHATGNWDLKTHHDFMKLHKLR